jgi:hypothetical protein
MTIQNGLKAMFGWTGNGERQEGHVLQMTGKASRAARLMGRDCVAVFDSYFLSAEVVRRVMADERLEVIVRCKDGLVGYLDPPENEPGKRGPKPKKGAKVKIFDQFEEKKGSFTSHKVRMYGKKVRCKILCLASFGARGFTKRSASFSS